MIGLLKNYFYSAIDSLKLFLIFLLLLSIAIFIGGNQAFLHAFIAIATPGFSMLSIAGLRKETISKWYKHKLTFPLNRKQIVHSFYISHAIWTILGIILTIIVIVITVIIHGNKYFDLGLRDAIGMITTSGVVSLMVGGIFCPLFYCLGSNKADVLVIISFVGAIGVIFGFTWIMNMIYEGPTVSDLEFYISLLFILTASIILFLVSSIVAILVYTKKEC